MISDKKLRQLLSEKGQKDKWPLQLGVFTVVFALVLGLIEFAFYGFTMEGHTTNDLLAVDDTNRNVTMESLSKVRRDNVEEIISSMSEYKDEVS
jgi:hypothetical protein